MDNIIDKADITWEEGYRELWRAMIAYVCAPQDNWRHEWNDLLAVMDRHNGLNFVQPAPISTVEDKGQLAGQVAVIALEDYGDSASMDGHLIRLMEAFKIGQLFSIPELMKACSVVRSQAYNIKDYWEARGRIVQAKRGRYYWTS